ncbi:hypothetical protein D3C84_950000 [compost metagenome]
MREVFSHGNHRAERQRHLLQLFDTLRAGQAQRHLSGLIKPLMEILQRLLKLRLLHGQAVAVAGMKAAQRMSRRKPIEQRQLLLCRRILRPGEKLRVQHFPFPQLIVQIHTRMSEHV